MRLLDLEGVVGMRRGLIALCACLALALALALAGAAPAFAGSPWWHLTSQSRPSYLAPGKATDEVQEIRVTGEEGLYLLVAEHGVDLGGALLTATATSSEVQHELEGVYGAGDVKVENGQPITGGQSYRVTFMGQRR
jgi:hypothetical protein